MTGQQQEAEPEPERTLGYCGVCHGYGHGIYVGTLNSNSEIITAHERCPGPRAARQAG